MLVGGTTGGLQKQNPAGLRRRGLGKSVLFLLPDPRRRVCNDAYYDDYADDNSRHCTGRAGAEVAGVGHGGMGSVQKIESELWRSFSAKASAIDVGPGAFRISDWRR